MVLLDTNVVSELRKGARADAGVRACFDGLAERDVHLAVHTVGELRCGVERLRGRGDAEQAARLERWLDGLVEAYVGRILTFDLDCAQVWGRLMASGPQHPLDRQSAAIALIHDMTVVTRNTAHFAGSGVRLHDPFTRKAGAGF